MSGAVMKQMRDTSMLEVGPCFDVVPIQDEVLGVVPDPEIIEASDGLSEAELGQCDRVVEVLSGRGAWSHTGEPVYIFELLGSIDGLSSTLVGLMVEAGVLRYTADDFGEVLVALVQGSCVASEWVSQATCDNSLSFHLVIELCDGVCMYTQIHTYVRPDLPLTLGHTA